MKDYYISATLRIVNQQLMADKEHIQSTPTIMCDSETCIFNPKGICLAPLITGHSPNLDDDGCYDYRAKDES